MRHARLRAELRVETWQTAHDVANAYLSMKHGVAKQAANELALKNVDKELFDQRISPAVVIISDEEVKLTFWRDRAHDNEISAPPRFLKKATCSALQPELEVSQKKGRMHALRVENWPITG